MKRLFVVVFVCSFFFTHAQVKRSQRYGELMVAAGSYRGTATISAVHRIYIGRQDRFSIGIGGRFTSFLGANIYYLTAPAKLTSGSEGPLVIFKENITQNIDTFLIKRPQVNAINLMINLEYRFGKIAAGFNIDCIGFSFGGRRRGNYINGPFGRNVGSKPTSFNLLLISDNDKGTLNSELFLRYPISRKWNAKIAMQFVFTEYTTNVPVQEFPEPNDRFRNKALLLAFGISQNF